MFLRRAERLSSEFSFSHTGDIANPKDLTLTYYPSQSWIENNWIHTFPEDINPNWNVNVII